MHLITYLLSCLQKTINRTQLLMKTAILLVLSGMAMHPAGAQSLRYSMAQPYISLSAYSGQQQHPLSFTGNQAALAQQKSAGAGMYGERRFMLAETSRYTAGVSVPTRLGNVAVQMNYAGFKNFNELSIGLAYARRLGSVVDVGIQFNYYGYRMPAYGNASAIYAEIGTILHVTGQLQAGVHVYNPVGGRIGKDKTEKLASAYTFGLGYDASDQFFIAAEIIKEEDKPVNVISGLEYHLAKRFFIKAGFLAETATVYAGAGIAWKNLRLDISAAYHPKLGFSPGILLFVHFKKPGE